MKKKLYSSLLLLLVILTSVLIIILPSFLTKGISRISLHQELNLPLILNDTKDIKFIFFGYSGCSDICTPRLSDIATFYSTLNEQTKKRLGLEFLDISQPADKTLPDSFAKFFHKNFEGIYLDPLTLRNYTKEFQVYFSQSLLDKTEYNHTANLYIVKKTNNTKELRYIYTAYPFDFEQIKLDIEDLQSE